MADTCDLHLLPPELLSNILGRLPHADLKTFNLLSSTCRRHATALLWKHVDLADCRTVHRAEGEPETTDEHDDFPIIMKLVILATNPQLASCVHTVSHRCHYVQEVGRYDLKKQTFSAQTLSSDPRTSKLVQIASKQMTSVHTLRITQGHPTLTDALLRCFFDSERKAQGCVPVQELYLTRCRISAGCNLSLVAHPCGLPLQLSFADLRIARLRSVPLRPGIRIEDRNTPTTVRNFVYTRNPHDRLRTELHEGSGGRHTVFNQNVDHEAMEKQYTSWMTRSNQDCSVQSPLVEFFAPIHNLDNFNYTKIAERMDLPKEVVELGLLEPSRRALMSYRGSWLDPVDLENALVDPVNREMQRERVPSQAVAVALLRDASATLTSLKLEGTFQSPDRVTSARCCETEAVLLSLFACRFPLLRVLQSSGNPASAWKLPSRLYLLDRPSLETQGNGVAQPTASLPSANTTETTNLAALEFMEAHARLTSLAWPMENFFSHDPMNEDISLRVTAVLESLGRSLTELRTETVSPAQRKLRSGKTQDPDELLAESRRRKFINIFATRMRAVTSIELRGKIPRDERREVVRALHACPLSAIVLSGEHSQLGNTWGEGAAHVTQYRQFLKQEGDDIEGEDEAAFFALGSLPPSTTNPHFVYQAAYGWEGAAPMLKTLADFHADTVKELEFFGLHGAPLLYEPTAVTAPCLAALRHFHKLEHITMNMALVTEYQRRLHDQEVMAYWRDALDSASTALVPVTTEELKGWAKELKTRYAPDALARGILAFFGPYLSERAKADEGGVYVRVVFGLGVWETTFNMDVWIGKAADGSDVILEFEGPTRKRPLEWRKAV